MSNTPRNLTRNQLAEFLPNQRAIRAFEQLLKQMSDLLPSDIATINRLIQEAYVEAANGTATANEALSALQRIADSLDVLAKAPPERSDASATLDYIDFAVAPPVPAVNQGRLRWNGGYTLNLDMTTGVKQSIGEAQYYYIKATSAIAKGQMVMFTGSVGASGQLTGAPATGVTIGDYLMGVAAEDIALNAFGLVNSFGLVRGFDTSGAPYGEVWADGDVLYFNPAVAGGLTKNLPVAPNVKATVAAVVNASSGGSGSVFVRVSPGSKLGASDSNVQFGALVDKQLIQYDAAAGYWKNVSLAAAGAVTSVTGTAPVVSSGGATPAISMAAATTSANGYLTSTDWNTFNSKQSALVSGTNIKTVGGNSLLGSGDVGTIAPNYGGTGITGYTIGDIVYASGATTLSKLAGVAIGNALISGGVGAAPSWGKIGLTTHVSGTLPVANGGTGLTSYTANQMVYASGTTTLASSSNVYTDGTKLSIGDAVLTVELQAKATGEVSSLNRNTVADGVIIRYQKQGSTIGYISTNTYALPSDIRVKKNVAPLEYGLDFIMDLDAIQYQTHFQDPESNAFTFGLSAQQVEAVLAKRGKSVDDVTFLEKFAEHEEGQSQYGLGYQNLVPVLILGVQQQQQQIEQLKQEIDSLKKEQP